MFGYELYGLTWRSDLQLRMLRSPSLVRSTVMPDVEVRRGAIPLSLEPGQVTAEGFEVRGDTILFSFARAGRFFAQAGTNLTIEAPPDANPADTEFYVVGPGLSCILHQRSMRPLHGGAAIVNGKAIIYCGHSGRGKSTFTALLARAGYSLLSDDRIIIRLDGRGVPMVLPSVPVLSLSDASLELVGAFPGEIIEPAMIRPKRLHIAPEAFSPAPAPLGCLIFLHWGGEGGLSIREMSPFEAIASLRENANFESLVRALGKERDWFAWASQIAHTTPAYEVTRPLGIAYMQELLSVLGELISSTVSTENWVGHDQSGPETAVP